MTNSTGKLLPPGSAGGLGREHLQAREWRRASPALRGRISRWSDRAASHGFNHHAAEAADALRDAANGSDGESMQLEREIALGRRRGTPLRPRRRNDSSGPWTRSPALLDDAEHDALDPRAARAPWREHVHRHGEQAQQRPDAYTRPGARAACCRAAAPYDVRKPSKRSIDPAREAALLLGQRCAAASRPSSVKA